MLQARLLGKSIGRGLFKLARSRLAGGFVRWSFAHASSLMPVHKLHETDLVVAFAHPKPAYPVHILIVPKRSIANLLMLDGADYTVLCDVVLVAQHLVRELQLDKQGYRLVVNGGAYQDVQQLHFHLTSGRP